MNPSGHQGGVPVRSDRASDESGILVLVGGDGETEDSRPEVEDLLPDSLQVQGTVKSVIDMDQAGLMSPLLQYGGQERNAIVEADLGMKIGINEEDIH